MNNKDTRNRNVLVWILFLLYMVVLVYLLFFSDTYGRTTLYEEYQYNLVPFKEIKLFRKLLGGKQWHLYLINVLGNIVIFVPFGFLILKLKRIKPVLVALLGVLFSLLIETIQLFTRVGVFDVDDIILNSLGVILGIICYLIDVLIKRRKNRR